MPLQLGRFFATREKGVHWGYYGVRVGMPHRRGDGQERHLLGRRKKERSDRCQHQVELGYNIDVFSA